MSSPTASAPTVWTPDIQLFDAKLAKFQRTSAEIVVFCPPLHMAVAIPWYRAPSTCFSGKPSESSTGPQFRTSNLLAVRSTSKHAALLRYLTCAHDEPRVPGYWGEFNKGKQLGGVVIASDAPTETLQPGDVAAATSRVFEAVQADSPFFFLPPSDLNILTLLDAAHFISLAQGGGISSKALHTLLTQCPGCSKYFVGTFVEEHIESCGQ
ncbi:hypothetical protein C8J57DRAFT_1253715 [Mycena rebaudengoi]|nr:hypothetical protein C8J57DRAFT_1253715 [Mycena rebaudengoi]